jgi:hypothetical protein
MKVSRKPGYRWQPHDASGYEYDGLWKAGFRRFPTVLGMAAHVSAEDVSTRFLVLKKQSD